jgi:hypothetical protein
MLGPAGVSGRDVEAAEVVVVVGYSIGEILV